MVWVGLESMMTKRTVAPVRVWVTPGDHILSRSVLTLPGGRGGTYGALAGSPKWLIVHPSQTLVRRARLRRVPPPGRPKRRSR